MLHRFRPSVGTQWTDSGESHDDRGLKNRQVAARAGNSVEVLPSRYAKCLDGRQEVGNRRIDQLLSEYD